jgi:N-acetylneuraminic acid mutarotase
MQEEFDERVEAPQLRFRKPRTEGKRMAARGGHTAVVIKTDLIFFGGHHYSGGGKFTYYNDTTVLDLETNTWHVVKCGGTKPSPRYGHTASVIGNRMYIFGGKGPDEKLYNDIFFLDTLSWCWIELSSTTAPPPPRFGHAETVVGDKIVVCGGWDGHQCRDSNIWIFDTSNSTWLEPRVSGRPPRPRQGHVMELTEDGRILVFGGMTIDDKGHPHYLNDLRSLDIETMVWSSPMTGGVHVEPRMAMTSTMIGKYFCLIGGFIKRKADLISGQPSNSNGDGVGRRIKSPTTGDHIVAFDTEELQWVNPEFFGYCPEDVYGHSISVAASQIIIYGGWGGNRALDELFVGEPLGAFKSAFGLGEQDSEAKCE